MSQHKLITLKNGLRVLISPMSQVESVTIMVAVAAGSRNETKEVNGLFHFIEHMAFKGTKKRPSASKIASEIDSVGGMFNAFTDKEMTAYHIKLAAKHTELAFDILGDMMTNSLFKKEEIEKEKSVLIEELNMYEDMPMRRVEEVFIRLLYGDNSMGWGTGGEKETIRKIQREDFLNFQNKLYFAKNMAVVVSGKVKEEEIKQLAKKYLGDFLKIGQKVSKSIILHQEKPKIKLVFKKTEQAHLCLGVPGYTYSSPRRFPTGVIAAILSGGMSSRLFQQIRERRGLAYYVLTMPEFNTDSGYLFSQAGVRLEKIEEAIKVIMGEYQDLAKKKVAPKELTKAKEYLKGGMILALEDSQQVANRYAYQVLLEGEIRTPEEVIKLIDAVTAEEVQETAKELFQQKNLNLAIIGPYKEEGRFKKILEA